MDLILYPDEMYKHIKTGFFCHMDVYRHFQFTGWISLYSNRFNKTRWVNLNKDLLTITL